MKKMITVALSVACLSVGAARAQDTTIVDTPNARSVQRTYRHGPYVSAVTDSVDRHGTRCHNTYRGVRTRFGAQGGSVRRCWRRY